MSQQYFDLTRDLIVNTSVPFAIILIALFVGTGIFLSTIIANRAITKRNQHSDRMKLEMRRLDIMDPQTKLPPRREGYSD